MSFLVARIDYALTRGIGWLTTCLAERARGYDSSEAGDYLADPDLHEQRVRLANDAADALADREAEEEVAAPRYTLEDIHAIQAENARARWGDIFSSEHFSDTVRTLDQSVPAGVSADPSPAPPAGPSIADTSPALLALLEAAADKWGGLGVARAAAHLIGYTVVPAPPLFETGIDMGVSVASEFFPQHRNTQT